MKVDKIKKRLDAQDEIDMLVQQKAQHDALVNRLLAHISLLNDIINDMDERNLVRCVFLSDKHPELAAEYVSLAFECLEDDLAVDEVAFLHDETIDLSTLPKTKNHFKGWKV